MARRPAKTPLALETFGHFFVGGQIEPAIEGSPMVGHMYVEYQIPASCSIPTRS